MEQEPNRNIKAVAAPFTHVIHMPFWKYDSLTEIKEIHFDKTNYIKTNYIKTNYTKIKKQKYLENSIKIFIILITIISVSTFSSCNMNPVLPDFDLSVTLVAPGSDELNALPTFEWKASGYITAFQIMIAPSPSELIDNVITTIDTETDQKFVNNQEYSYTPTADVQLAGESYYWKIRLMNDFRYYESNTKIFFTHDETPPTIEMVTPNCDGGSVESTLFTLTGYLEDNWSISSGKINVNSEGFQNLTLVQSETDVHRYDWDFEYDFSKVDTGTYPIEIQATDASGNTASLSCSVVVKEFEDSFDDNVVDSGWQVLHYDGDGEVSESNGKLRIDNGVSGGDFWGKENLGSILYRNLPTHDFEATISITAVSSFNYSAVVGLFCDASNPSTENYIVQSKCCDYPDGFESWGIISRYADGEFPVFDNGSSADPIIRDFYIKIARVDGKISFFYSLDGDNYSIFSSTIQNYTPSCELQHIGLLSGSTGIANNKVFIENFHITTEVSTIM